MNEITEIRPITDHEAAGVVSAQACAELMEMVTSMPVREDSRHGRRLFARKHNNRRSLLVGGGAMGLAAVAAAAVLIATAATSAPPAYALTQNPDGSVTVTINDVANAVAAVNAKFAAAGINDTVVPVTADCPATGNLADQLMLEPASSPGDSLTVTRNVDPGYQGVIAAEQLPDGQVAMTEEAIKPPIPTCFPTTAYTLVKIGEHNGIPVYKITPANLSGN